MAPRPAGRLRIIGGEFRSRVLGFDTSGDVRPTPDRVRQTLFDWLAPLISGARVLDLFAGSGALGLEALSRGAAHATFVESSSAQAQQIQHALRHLKIEERGKMVPGDALRFLNQTEDRYDIVFLDPPYGSGLFEQAVQRIAIWQPPPHRIYLEWPARQRPDLPANMRLLREKKAGQVSYGLAVCDPSASDV